MGDAAAHVEQVGAAHHLGEGAEAHPRHQLAHLLGHEEEVVDDVLGLAGEALDELGVLGGDAHRAGVEVALAHHDAALDHQRRRGEAHLVGPEEGGDDHVAPRLHLAVGLHRDAAAEAVQHQGLLGFGEAHLPRAPGVLDGRERRGAGAAVVSRDGHVIRVRLGDARGDRAHALLGDQLDADARLGVHVLQVVNELGQILDGVDVVVGRRRDEADARHRVADLGDVPGHLVPGELPALAGLGALSHLDLEVVRVDQVLGGDAEAPGRHLLDRRSHRVAVGQAHVAGRVLAALAGVRFTPDAVHRDGQRAVRLRRERPERHRAGGEALDDLARRLDLLERDGVLGVLDGEEAAQRHQALALVVDERGVLAVGGVAARAGRVLELGHGLRRPQVGLAAGTERVVASGVEGAAIEGSVAVGELVEAHRLRRRSRRGPRPRPRCWCR